MSGKRETAISKWSQVSCQGDFLGILFSGPILSVAITAGKQISGISVVVPVGSLMSAG